MLILRAGLECPHVTKRKHAGEHQDISRYGKIGITKRKFLIDIHPRFHPLFQNVINICRKREFLKEPSIDTNKVYGNELFMSVKGTIGNIP
jgi:hypothetical protein